MFYKSVLILHAFSNGIRICIVFLAGALYAQWWTKDSEKSLESLWWTAWRYFRLIFYIPVVYGVRYFRNSSVSATAKNIIIVLNQTIGLNESVYLQCFHLFFIGQLIHYFTESSKLNLHWIFPVSHPPYWLYRPFCCFFSDFHII